MWIVKEHRTFVVYEILIDRFLRTNGNNLIPFSLHHILFFLVTGFMSSFFLLGPMQPEGNGLMNSLRKMSAKCVIVNIFIHYKCSIFLALIRRLPCINDQRNHLSFDAYIVPVQHC
jgi:hypothetical protein